MQWVVLIAYHSLGESEVFFKLGEGTPPPFHARGGGLHQFILTVVGGGDAIELTVQNPAALVCFDKITVGHPTPRP